MRRTARTLLVMVVGGLLLFTLYAAYVSIPEYAPALEWSKTYGMVDPARLVSIESAADGGYIIATDTYPYQDFIWLLKTSPKGDVQSSNTYGPGYLAAYAMQTSDDGYIAAGWSYLLQAFSTYRALLIKISGNGAQEWNRTYGFNSNNFTDALAHHVEETSDGGYILTGTCWRTPGEGFRIWLLKTTSDGSVSWNKTYSQGDDAYYVHETGDAGYVVAGTAGNSFLLFKTDEIGSLIWSQTYGSGATDDAISASSTSDGGYVIGGTVWMSSTESYGILVVKTDRNGVLQWQKIHDDGLDEHCRDVRQTTDGGYILAADTLDPSTGYTYPLVIKADADGKVQWMKRIWEENILQAWDWGARGADAMSVVQSPDGGYAVAGYLLVDYGDGHGVASLWIGKLAETPAYAEAQSPLFASLIAAGVLEFAVLLWLSAAVIRNRVSSH